MRVRVKSFFVIFSLLIVAAALLVFLPSAKGASADTVKLQSDGDAVVSLADGEYSATEKRMLAATADFSDGAECGLVFGARDGEYFVFKINRADNEVVFAHFDGDTENVLEREFYVGPSNMSEDEQDYVALNTAELERVYLRVVVAPAGDKTDVELYADGIKRFVYTDGAREAERLYIQDYELEYGGGAFGYYCGEYASAVFSDVTSGASDHSYYNETYRNQIHFSQYAHWNNDPNGLVYYGGYYHVYFQHNPYGDVWGPMHWGHARSRDLAHWEMLPIALVPDYEQDGVLGMMWSGSVRVYHKGDSALIDGGEEYKWFDEDGKSDGDAVGLIGFYTRHDDEDFGGNRYTVVMYSDDGGITWNKRDAIHRTTSLFFDGCKLGCNADGEPWGANVRPSWRDPKVFDISTLEGNDGYKWSMALTGMEDQALYFLKSKDMVNWEHAGVYKIECRPECPDVFDVGGHTVITLTSRYYFVCDLAYDGGNIVMNDLAGNRITELLSGDPRLKKMEYGPDSYAAQTFYIDGDSDSPYKNRVVGLSWFSGVPGADISVDSGALAAPRKTWNGGGFTVPVVFGLDGDTLTQTPVVKDDAAFGAMKSSLINVADRATAAGEDVLAGFSARSGEIAITLSNPTAAPVSIKVNERTVGGAHYYTEIGWSSVDGYYVSREHSEDGGIAQGNYNSRFVSGVGKTDTVLDFYILIDRNSVEAFCGNGRAAFYAITFASPYSTGASFTAGGAVTASVSASAIATGYRQATNEIMIDISSTALDLGDELTSSKEITAYAEGAEIAWRVIEGADVIEVVKTDAGAIVRGLSGGAAKIEASVGGMKRIVDVTVHSGEMAGSLAFASTGIVLGEYYYDGDTLVGSQPSGDGFILSEDVAGDFESYSARFDLGDGPAAALVFRASMDAKGITDGLIVNYDNNSSIVKMWSLRDGHGFATAEVERPDITDMTLSVKAAGNRVWAALDGVRVLDVTLRADDPTEGRFGLNVCKTRAVFKELSVLDTAIAYKKTDDNYGELELVSNFEQESATVVNRTLGNSAVPEEYMYVDGNRVVLDLRYMSILPRAGKYVFRVDGGLPIDYTVNVKEVPLCELSAATIYEKADLSTFVGGRKIDLVFVNGSAVATRHFDVRNYVLTLSAEALSLGDNTVKLVRIVGDEYEDIGEFEVTVMALRNDTVDVYVPPRKLDFVPMTIGLCTVAGVILLATAALIVLAALIKRGRISPPRRDDGRTEAYRRRDLGLIAGAAIILPIVLFLSIGLITSPYTVSGCVGWIVMLVIAIAFGYPFAAQMFWNGKIYRSVVSPMNTRGTPKEIFAVDKSGKKLRTAWLYVLAALKTAWLCIVIGFYGAVALIKAPFLFVSQMRGLLYGEFGYSAEANAEIAKEEE